MLDERYVEGRDSVAALDRLLEGSRSITTASPAVVLEDLATLFGDPPPAGTVIAWLGDNHILGGEALATSEQLLAMWENQLKVWERTVGSGDLGDVLVTVGLMTKEILLRPDTFAEAFREATYTAFMGQIVDTWEYFAGVARWALQMGDCRFAVQLSALRALAMEDWTELELDPKACGWVLEFIAQTQRTLDSGERLWEQLGAWGEAVTDQPSLVLAANVAYQEFVITVLDLLLKDKTYYEFLQSKAKAGPHVLGVLFGTVLGFVGFEGLWMLAGAGVGSVGRVGKVLWEIAEMPLPLLPSEQDENAEMRRLRLPRTAAAVRPPRKGALPADEIRRRLVKYLDMLGEDGARLIDDVAEAARKAQGALTRKITDPRLRRILKALDENTALREALDTLRHAVRAGFEDARFAFGAHKDVAKWGAHINQGANSLAYLELIEKLELAAKKAKDAGRPVPRMAIDRAEEALATVMQLDQVVDAAHAIDQNHWAKIRPIFQAAGIPWETTDDIYSMLLTNAEHRSNALRALAKTGGLNEADLGSFNEHKSLTETLKSSVKWGKKPKDASHGVFYLDEKASTADDIIDAYESITRAWAEANGVDSRFFKAQKRMYDGIRRLKKS